MTDRELEGAIIKAVAGDSQAMEDVLLQYMPLINRASIVDGCVDEDCRQHILLKLVIAIMKFTL